MGKKSSRKQQNNISITFKGSDYSHIVVTVGGSTDPPGPIPKDDDSSEIERSPNPTGNYWIRPNLANEEKFSDLLVSLHKKYKKRGGEIEKEKYLLKEARYLAATQCLGREYADKVAEKALRKLEFGSYKKHLISKVRKALDKEEEQ